MFPETTLQRRVIIAWSLLSGIIHIVWEGAWSLAAPWLTAASAQHDWRIYWTLYGRADARYVHADPFIRTLELVTGTIVAVLNLWCAYRFWRGRGRGAATLGLFAASVMEVYGTLLYFGSELFNNWANVDTASVVHTWIMFFGLNALWLLFPGWCIYEIIVAQLGVRRRAAAGSQLPVAAH